MENISGKQGYPRFWKRLAGNTGDSIFFSVELETGQQKRWKNAGQKQKRKGPVFA